MDVKALVNPKTVAEAEKNWQAVGEAARDAADELRNLERSRPHLVREMDQRRLKEADERIADLKRNVEVLGEARRVLEPVLGRLRAEDLNERLKASLETDLPRLEAISAELTAIVERSKAAMLPARSLSTVPPHADKDRFPPERVGAMSALGATLRDAEARLLAVLEALPVSPARQQLVNEARARSAGL